MLGLEPTILGSLQNAQEEAMFLDNFAGTYVSGCDQIYPWWMISSGLILSKILESLEMLTIHMRKYLVTYPVKPSIVPLIHRVISSNQMFSP